MGRKKLEINQGSCINGCKEKVHARGLCKNCYRKVHYKEHERVRRYPHGISKDRESDVGKLRYDVSGYVYVKVPKGYSGFKREWMKQHRYIMEQKLGRKLFNFEDVHHKNGIKHDNRENNLELWIIKHPRGQRPIDLIEYAEWILKTYKNE